MSVEKKFAPTFKVYSPVDLSKQWFIFWYDKEGRRKKRGAGINCYHTFDERMEASLALIERLKAEASELKPISLKLEDWVNNRRGFWRKKTYQTHKSKIDCFLRWRGFRRIDAKLMKDFFIHLANKRHGKTYNAYLRCFKQVFKGIGQLDLLDSIEPLNAKSSPAKYFQRHQIERIKKHLAVKDPELWLFCGFIYYCFIRPGELRLLKVGDILFDEWKICVRSKISKNKTQQYVTIPLAFRSSIEWLKERSPQEYLFPSKKDVTKPQGANTMLYRFRKILTELGFGTEYKLYSWKHTGAVACVRAGVGVKQLQIQLRHHSLEEVDKYLRQLGVWDLEGLEEKFPEI